MSSPWRFWIMVALLLGARIALQRLSHGEAVTLAKSLNAFPLQMDQWRGRDVSLDPRIVHALGVNDYLNRVYQAPDLGLVFLYVGYYRTQRTGISIHSPKNCLPGAGWEPVSAGYRRLVSPDGEQVTVNQYLVEKGLQRELVLYWYQSHGRVIANEYRGKLYIVLDSLRLNRTDATLVRVSTTVSKGDDKASLNRTISFAQEFLARSKDVLPN